MRDDVKRPARRPDTLDLPVAAPDGDPSPVRRPDGLAPRLLCGHGLVAGAPDDERPARIAEAKEHEGAAVRRQARPAVGGAGRDALRRAARALDRPEGVVDPEDEPPGVAGPRRTVRTLGEHSGAAAVGPHHPELLVVENGYEPAVRRRNRSRPIGRAPEGELRERLSRGLHRVELRDAGAGAREDDALRRQGRLRPCEDDRRQESRPHLSSSLRRRGNEKVKRCKAFRA